jgi:opacity protein-like surface antigen
MNNKKYKLSLILVSILSLSEHASAASNFDIRGKGYFIGGGISKSIIANDMKTNAANRYESNKKPKNKFAPNIFIGKTIANNIDASLAFEYGSMSYKNGYIPSTGFLNNNGTNLITTVESDANSRLKFKYYNISADVRYLFKNDSSVSPFIGAGVGTSITKTQDYIITSIVQPLASKKYPGKSTKNISYNMKLGVNYQINDKHSLQIFYKYQHLGKIQNASKLIYNLENGNTLSRDIPSNKKSRLDIQSVGVSYTMSL